MNGDRHGKSQRERTIRGIGSPRGPLREAIVCNRDSGRYTKADDDRMSRFC